MLRQLEAAGYRTRVLTRSASLLPGFEVVRGDVTDPRSLRDAVRDVDAVVHLAGVAGARGADGAVVAVNGTGTANLLAALSHSRRRSPMPFVLASSSAVYGSTAGRLAETCAVAPANAYGESKLVAEEHLRLATSDGVVSGTGLRCFNVAGAVAAVPDRDSTRILNRALAVASGRVRELTLNGNGGARRDYVHVQDVATAYRLALARLLAQPETPFRVYNIGSGRGVSLLEMVEAVRAVTGRPIPVAHGPAAPEAPELVADPTLGWHELDWEAQFSGTGRIVHDAWSAITGPSP